VFSSEEEKNMALHLPGWQRLDEQQTRTQHPAASTNGHRSRKLARPLLRAFWPGSLRHDEQVIIEHIREGRFQRGLSLVTAFSSLLSGLEVTYEHYIGSYSQRIMYTPVILCGGLCTASVWGLFNRRAARLLLPPLSALLLADGVVGFVLHVRGIERKPGGWRIPVVNIIMGPPLMAPLLMGTSGFLGLITAYLRREDDPACPPLQPRHRQRSLLLEMLPQSISQDISTAEQDIREGRFQCVMGVATAISAFFSGFEALYSHYKNNFTYRVEWVPIALTPAVMLAGLGTIWSRTMGKIVLPITSAMALASGMLGLFYHMRGLVRRPGGLKKPFYNLLYGPPIFAPLLFSATGFLGLLASLLRRAK
jgi:hypothetical protein